MPKPKPKLYNKKWVPIPVTIGNNEGVPIILSSPSNVPTLTKSKGRASKVIQMPANMALLQTFSPYLSSSHPSHCISSTSTPMCMLQWKTLNLQHKVFGRFGISTPSGFERRGVLVVEASSNVDGVSAGGADPPPEGKEESVPVENLPLESKLQLKLEAKLRMKLAKKIRLKRKRLVMKRRLRKKGRWPPSKMKKNKNV